MYAYHHKNDETANQSWL